MADNEALAARTLSGCGSPYGNIYTTPAYLLTLLKLHENAEISAVVPDNQNFASYATDFEKEYSILAASKSARQGKAAPVVEPRANPSVQRVPSLGNTCMANVYPVVGHFGKFSGYSIAVKNGRDTTNFLTSFTGDDSVLIRTNPPRGYHNYSSSEQYYRMVTDIDGRVLLWIDGYATAGAIGSSAFATAAVAGVRKQLGVTTLELLTIVLRGLPFL